MEDLIEILIFVGVIGWTVVSLVIKQKSESAKQAVPKGRPQHLEVEEDERHTVRTAPARENITKDSAAQPFSYETMSDRDFKAEFDKNSEEGINTAVDDHSAGNPLDFSEEEIYKGVIYSEILKKKY